MGDEVIGLVVSDEGKERKKSSKWDDDKEYIEQ